jgi:hypothetical protein
MYIFTDSENKVTLITYEPTPEQVQTGIEVASLPERPDSIKGKDAVLKYGDEGLFYELIDRPLTQEEIIGDIFNNQKSAVEQLSELDTSAASLSELKAVRIAALKEECTAAIHDGFVSGLNEFGYNENDQLNFNSQTNKLNLLKNRLTEGAITQEEYDAKFPIQWKSKNNGVVALTEAEFVQVLDDAEAHQRVQQGKYWQLESQILAAETNEDVVAVIW